MPWINPGKSQLFFVSDYVFVDYYNKHLICDKANELARKL